MGGANLFGILGIIFIVLKLVDVIAWSWWWVCSPIMVDVVLTIILMLYWSSMKKKVKNLSPLERAALRLRHRGL